MDGLMSRARVGAALAVALCGGCGGAAAKAGGFSGGSGSLGSLSGSDVGSAMDAESLNDGAGGDASNRDASLDWCALQSPSHLLCEDFDQGVPGQLASKTYGGAVMAADVSEFVSAPESMWISIPALAGPHTAAGALASAPFPMTGPHVQLRAEFQIAAECAANNDGVTVAAMTFGNYSVDLVAALGASYLVELAQGPDGGLASSASHRLASPIPTDSWTPIVLEVDLSTHDASVTLPGAPAIDQPLSLAASPGPAPAATLGLGAEIQNQAGMSAGCRVRVDNVLFDSF
jgi:hypothetical protein